MLRTGLKTRVVMSFLLIVACMGFVIALFGYYQIRTNVVERAQKQLRYHLSAARSVYQNELDCMARAFEVLDCVKDPAKLKRSLNLDYLLVVEPPGKDAVRSPTVERAFGGSANGGTRIIDSAELTAISPALYEKALIPIKATPKARPTAQTALTSAMAIEFAAPLFNADGTVARVVYGGKIVNRYFDLIERMHHIVFEDALYKTKPVGTVTIFQGGVRVATNVLDKNGLPAIGTRVSDIVYDNVLLKGKPWYSRAFVVTDWYLTAYEPIRDVQGRIAGILYVGALEAPFGDMIRSSLAYFLLILGGCALLAVVLTFFLAGSILNPLTRLVKATATLAKGDLSHRVTNDERIREIHTLAHSFNEMADTLDRRDASVRKANEELAVLNKRYLDLVAIVSHELNGILSSTMLNAYSLRDRHLGPVTEAQGTALESITRNLEYFDMTVKNFLNLSRIEKGELALAPTAVRLKEIIVESIRSFARQAQDRGISIVNNVPDDMTLTADGFLLLMVVNNLLGNAVKYGAEQGRIVICGHSDGAAGCIEVFSEGRPITPDEQERLFKRFSRLSGSPEGKRVRGTGLGLFISRQIVGRQGGAIRCEPRENGNAFIVTLPVQSIQQP